MKQSQWVVVLRETKLSSVMTRQVAEAICLEHDTRADGTLDYAALCDDIFPGDFDHFAHQQHFVYKVLGFAYIVSFVLECRSPARCPSPSRVILGQELLSSGVVLLRRWPASTYGWCCGDEAKSLYTVMFGRGHGVLRYAFAVGLDAFSHRNFSAPPPAPPRPPVCA